MDSDEALFERLVAGDLRAFDHLYERHERPLLGFIRMRLGSSAAEAEDVMHDAFMALLRERGARGEVRSFRAWLYQIAHHLCLNRARAGRRAGRAHEAVAEPAMGGGASTPADQLIDRERRTELLRRALTRLPASLAELYRLRASGMSYEEVATALEVPIGTVKSRMHELVKRLREEMPQ